MPVDDAFCSQCGARVELGSVLGVGTDLPPVPPRDRPQSPPSATPAPEVDAERDVPSTHAPAPDESDDLSQTRELPRIDPGAAGPTARPTAPAPAPATAHREPAPATAPPSAPMAEDDGAPAHSRSSILAMVATFAVLTIIGTLALTRLVGGDDTQPTTQPTTQSSASSSVTAEESGDAPSTGASPAQPSASPSGSPSVSPTQEVSPSASTSMPPQARRCSTSGSDAVATAYAGTERTSCEFAAAVREAYRNAGTPGGATSLRAYSPVTKKWYSLSCDGGEPVRCTSTTNAIVLLAP
ncbi:hypothetical protein LL946_07090 [Knoellia locipacati]|uniref:hypothetical protein n=1 Tax=Knoellia locipacati TaxID=882824 RepID=UPI00384E8149